MVPRTCDTTAESPVRPVKITAMVSSAAMKISPMHSDETTMNLPRSVIELESKVATLMEENEQLREQLRLVSMERQHDHHRDHKQQQQPPPLLVGGKVEVEETRSSKELFAMQQAIRESEERHKTLFENMNQGCVYHDATGQTVIANKSALQILGLSMDQMLGKVLIDPQWRFVREDGSTLPIEEYPIMLALQGKPVRNMKMGVYNTIEQRVRWVMLDAMTRCREGERTPYEAYTIFTDITEEMETKMNLIRAKEIAEEADYLKSGKKAKRNEKNNLHSFLLVLAIIPLFIDVSLFSHLAILFLSVSMLLVLLMMRFLVIQKRFNSVLGDNVTRN